VAVAATAICGAVADLVLLVLLVPNVPFGALCTVQSRLPAILQMAKVTAIYFMRKVVLQ
jgi:hypothetical protein